MAVSTPDLSGHTALVTGASNGIGAATARMLAASGAAVLLSSLRLRIEPGPDTSDTYAATRGRTAEEVAEEIRSSGGHADAVEADLRDATTVPRLFDSAERAFGPVDILVNNASGWTLDSFASSGASSGTDRHGR